MEVTEGEKIFRISTHVVDLPDFDCAYKDSNLCWDRRFNHCRGHEEALSCIPGILAKVKVPVISGQPAEEETITRIKSEVASDCPIQSEGGESSWNLLRANLEREGRKGHVGAGGGFKVLGYHDRRGCTVLC